VFARIVKGKDAMIRKPAQLMFVAVAAFALLVAACSSASDVVADNVAEQLIEAGVDGDVDVDVSGDGEDMSINVESEDGDFSIDVSGDGDDATIEMETEDGSIVVGSGAELPDGLEIPVPDGGDVMTSIEMEDGAMVSLTYDHGRYDEIVEFYEDWTAGSGDEWESQTMSFDSGEGTQRTTLWIGTDNGDAISVGDCIDVDVDEGTSEVNATCVTITQEG
jgi:hypothetical protein